MPADAINPDTLPGRGRVIVAFSGGPDSVCLLHRLLASGTSREIACVHVDHRLDPDSPDRAERAVAIAEQLGAPCRVVPVEVSSEHGGPEAAARQARYEALAAGLQRGDVLLTAHHADDQSETVLLRLVRGAGPEGLAGIPPIRRFGAGWLARPLLDWQRREIEDWIERHGLDCIRDPANDSLDFDRNHLRHDILPALRERWPGVDGALRRSGRLCRGAADFVAARVAADLPTAATPETLALDRLADQSDYYRGCAIRAWCIDAGHQPPPGRRLEELLGQIAAAGGDRCPQLRWNDCLLRYWADRLWLQYGEDPPADWRLDWDGNTALQLPYGLGTLELSGPVGPPLALRACAGRSGERLRPQGDPHHRECTRLLAEAGVPPWQRQIWPRLYLDGRLQALGMHWQTEAFRALLKQRGQALVWTAGTRRLTATAIESRP